MRGGMLNEVNVGHSCDPHCDPHYKKCTVTLDKTFSPPVATRYQCQ
jgi:hypothetical protein